MPECQFRVFCCFGFRNPTRKISSKSGEIFSSEYKRSGSFRSPETTWGEPLGAHTPWGHGLGWGRTQLGCGVPGWPPAPILRLYIPLDAKTLIRKDHIPRKVPSRPSSSISDRGSSDVLPGTLPEEKSITGGFYIIMPASGVMRE